MIVIPRPREPQVFFCPIHEVETIRSCPYCLEKIREDIAHLRGRHHAGRPRKSKISSGLATGSGNGKW